MTIKVKLFVQSYERSRLAKIAHEAVNSDIKWDAELDRLLKANIALKFQPELITPGTYRAFTRRYAYFAPGIVRRRFRLPRMLGKNNPLIVFDGMAASYPLCALAVDGLFDKGLMKVGNGRAFGVSRYRYTPSGERVDNITDWAFAQFRARYPNADVTKDDIFAYCYAALHDPVYRETHADDLRREFPRLPLHDGFAQWVAWGEALMKLHIDYEKVTPFTLTRADAPDAKGRAPTPKLKSRPELGTVIVDTATQLSGIPPAAWTYRLGNRSAIDWVLDQHKEKTPRDPTVAAKFNTYRLVDHKEAMITLLARVVTVSLETVAITDAMRAMREEV